MTIRREIQRKPSVWILFSAIVIAFLLSSTLAFFFPTSPTPNPQAGLVVEMHSRFSTYYVSKTAEILFDGIDWVLGGTFVIWAWCNRHYFRPRKAPHATLLGGQEHVWKTDKELKKELDG